MFLQTQNNLLKRIFVLSAVILLVSASAHAQTISLIDGSTYNQDFNALSNTAGSTANNLTITGWFLNESGGGARDNEQYAVDAGGSNSGDIYSYGPAGSTDRALGCLQTGTLIPTIGACLTNNTGKTITSLYIAYYGEQWRISNTASARDDRLDFQYSTNATSLATGIWTDVNALDFTNPVKTNAVQVALNGNSPANRVSISATINGLNIANGATFWIRWNDLNASGADDGLAVDDFSLQPGMPNDVTFTSGSVFIPLLPTPGTANNVLGRMCLTADLSFAYLTSFAVNVSGAHSGLTNYKLWSSEDETFDLASDQLLSTVSDGAVVNFNSFSSAISTAGTYYFVTADLAPEATGDVTLSIANNSSFGITNGSLTTAVNNAQLSQSAAALPVELTSFAACSDRTVVTIKWTTASEINNYGFEIERFSNRIWEQIGFVHGRGNSNSIQHYMFADKAVTSGTFRYRLKQIDTDGNFKYHEEVEVSVFAPKEYRLLQNSPNPFNPSTAIKFQLPENTFVTIKVYDLIGREVATLVNEARQAGSHIVYWNSKDTFGQNVSSGIYLYKLSAGTYTETRKMNLLK